MVIEMKDDINIKCWK